MQIRITINFIGRVQGVGFRWQVAKIAESFCCTGYVRNLADGSVELLAEGEEIESHKFIEAVNSQMKNYWHDQTVDERPGKAHFSQFSIKY